MAKTKLVVEEHDVDARLADFGVTRTDIIRIALAALGARNDSIAFDPKTAKGQFSYIYGVRALRDVFVPAGYEPVSKQNIESVYDASNGRKIMFQSADTACLESQEPKAISDIGAGKETVIGNSSLYLFPYMEEEERARRAKLSAYEVAEAWYVYAAFLNDTVACELSQPASVVDKQFSDFIERIFILHEGGAGPAGLLNLDDNTPPTEIKPLISKR